MDLKKKHIFRGFLPHLEIVFFNNDFLRGIIGSLQRFSEDFIGFSKDFVAIF